MEILYLFSLKEDKHSNLLPKFHVQNMGNRRKPPTSTNNILKIISYLLNKSKHKTMKAHPKVVGITINIYLSSLGFSKSELRELEMSL